jgi:hypothetical protein
LLSIKADAWLNGTTHVAGKLNVVCDGLSRDINFTHESIPVHLDVRVQIIHDFLLICDPTESIAGEFDKHIQLLRNFLHVLQ